MLYTYNKFEIFYFKGKQIKDKFCKEVKALHEKDTDFAGIAAMPKLF